MSIKKKERNKEKMKEAEKHMNLKEKGKLKSDKSQCK